MVHHLKWSTFHVRFSISRYRLTELRSTQHSAQLIAPSEFFFRDYAKTLCLNNKIQIPNIKHPITNSKFHSYLSSPPLHQPTSFFTTSHPPPLLFQRRGALLNS